MKKIPKKLQADMRRCRGCAFTFSRPHTVYPCALHADRLAELEMGVERYGFHTWG